MSSQGNDPSARQMESGHNKWYMGIENGWDSISGHVITASTAFLAVSVVVSDLGKTISHPWLLIGCWVLLGLVVIANLLSRVIAQFRTIGWIQIRRGMIAYSVVGFVAGIVLLGIFASINLLDKPSLSDQTNQTAKPTEVK